MYVCMYVCMYTVVWKKFGWEKFGMKIFLYRPETRGDIQTRGEITTMLAT